MNGYEQPSAYHFSHDSIELASRAAVILSDLLRGRDPGAARFRALDLCSGCGVVGLQALRELEKRWPGILASRKVEFDFLEVQAVLAPYFEANRKSVEELSCETHWREMNYKDLLNADEGDYDFIVSNPPYFDPDQGKLPPSEFKARSRFFIDADFETLCRAIAHSLKPRGIAIFLARDLRDHTGGVEPACRRRRTMDQIFNPRGHWLELEPIRGTTLVRFVKGD